MAVRRRAGGAGDGQGPRRIMTPVDAALEILRGQAPGRGVHVRQIADAADAPPAGSRRAQRGLARDAHGAGGRAARAAARGAAPARARGRERPVRAGAPSARQRSWSAPSRCSARRAARCASGRWPRSSGASRSCRRSAFEALARVLLQREGFGPATFVKRVEGTIYVEALRGRGLASVAVPGRVAFGGASARPPRDRRAARGHPRARPGRGLLMLAGRLAEDAIAEWKQPGDAVEIADGAGDGRDLHPSRRRRHQHDGQRRLRRRRLLRRDRRGVIPVARAGAGSGGCRSRRPPRSRSACARGPAGDGPETLLLCEHDPVITLGRSAQPAHVLASRGRARARAASSVHARRAAATSPTTGPASWSAIRSCDCAAAWSATSTAMARGDRGVLAELGIDARWRRETPGLWVGGADGDAKICAFGVHVRHGSRSTASRSTSRRRWTAFDLIVPCGLPGARTSPRSPRSMHRGRADRRRCTCSHRASRARSARRARQ